MRTPLLLITTLVMGMPVASLANAPVVSGNQMINGRIGWVIESDRMRIGLLQGGGHIAELRLKSADPRLAINPLYTRDDPGYVGHLVCFPNYGSVSSPEEQRNGLRGHGEAGVVQWVQTRPPRVEADTLVFFYGAELPLTQYRIERAITLKAGETVVHVEEWVENLALFDRPYNHNQHPTFGSPFVTPGKNFLDMSAGRGMTDAARTAGGRWAPNLELTWPELPGTDGSLVNMRPFQAVPDGLAYTAFLLDQNRPLNWFTVYNSDYPLLVGYLLPTAENPWIIDWQRWPRYDTDAGIARGIEFGTSPFTEGIRASVERGKLFGEPAYRWIAGRQRRGISFTLFLAEIPPGFAGVQDVGSADDRITITERVTGRKLSLAGSHREELSDLLREPPPAPGPRTQ